VRFDPTTSGVKSATISIANDDSDENPYTITVTGSGISSVSKRVFVTATANNGNIGGIAAADALCVADANNPAGVGSGTWRAMLVDGTNRRACTAATCTDPAQNIAWAFAPLTPYVRSNGSTAIFTTNSAGVFDFVGSLSNSFGTAGTYWTGLNIDWTTFTDLCGNWLSNAGGAVHGARGSATVTTNVSISGAGGGPQCSNSYKLLCVEQ